MECKTGIINWQEDSSTLAYILAHALGHIFGMDHEDDGTDIAYTCRRGSWDGGPFWMDNTEEIELSCSPNEKVRVYEIKFSRNICRSKKTGSQCTFLIIIKYIFPVSV